MRQLQGVCFSLQCKCTTVNAQWIVQSTSTVLVFVVGNVYSIETADSSVESRITMYAENWFAPRRDASFIEFQVKSLYCITVIGK